MNVEITQKETEDVIAHLKNYNKMFPEITKTYPDNLDQLIDSLKFKLSLAKEN